MYTIAEAKNSIKNGIRGYLLKDANGAYVLKETSRLPFYLEGAPGIGKTEIVSQIATELEIGYVSFSLVHHTRNSLLGLPVIKDLENGAKYTCYTMSEILAKVEEAVAAGFKEGILLLDEFPCMSETILPTMLSFLQTKNIGSYTLPEGWVIVLCGNPPAYNKTARTFDAAIMDRLRKIEVEFQPEVFLEYGKKNDIHVSILEYLESHLQNVYFYKQEKKQLELVTCRGWENLSHMIKAYEALGQSIDKNDIGQYIKSEAIAADFADFYKEYNSMWNRSMVADILAGKKVQKYGNMCKKMDFKAKRNLLEYAVGILRTESAEANTLYECVAEGEAMLEEIKTICQMEKDTDNRFMLYNPSTPQLFDVLRAEEEIDTTSPMRQVLLERFSEWAEDTDDLFSFNMIDVFGSVEEKTAVFEVLYEALEGWLSFNKSVLRGSIENKANKIEHLLYFIDKIDTEDALLEHCFILINQSQALLRVVSECTPALYVEICKHRYAKVS